MKPRDKLPAWKRTEAYDRVQDCRTFLYLYAFITKAENQRVRNRVFKWLKKHAPATKKDGAG